VSKAKNKKRLDIKDLVTSYVQFDQLETYEHTKRRPIGIQISIRHKTGEIISAKAGYTNVRALSTASVYTQAWNEKVKRNSKHTEKMLKETKKALNPKGSLISCDADKKPLRLVKDMYTEPFITIQPSSNKNKKIDRVFRRIRQDISRLGRKTLSTTKRIENLQKHLDLYIDYNNVKRVA